MVLQTRAYNNFVYEKWLFSFIKVTVLKRIKLFIHFINSFNQSITSFKIQTFDPQKCYVFWPESHLVIHNNQNKGRVCSIFSLQSYQTFFMGFGHWLETREREEERERKRERARERERTTSQWSMRWEKNKLNQICCPVIAIFSFDPKATLF